MAHRLLAALSAVGVLLGFCVCEGNGEGLPRPRLVRFKMDFFPHILEWAPGRIEPEGELYEVEYRTYGNDSWKSAADCKGVSGLACDLTVETMILSKGCYARVRAVSGNRTSNWTRSTRFTPEQVTLPPPVLTMEVKRNTIHATLALPYLTWKNSTLQYEEIFPFNRVYRVYIRRTSDNLTFTQHEESSQFELSGLAWGKQYCVTVTPEIKSRGNLGISTEEQCVSVPEEDPIWPVVLAVFSGVSALCMLLIFGNIIACLYIRKPVDTPDTLKSPVIKRSFWMGQWQEPLWMDDVVVTLDEDSIKRLSMAQKNCTTRLSTDSGFCGDKFSLENERQSLTFAYDDQEHLLERAGPRGSEDSGTSRDSGICTRETSCGSTQLTCTEHQGYRKQLTSTQQDADIRDDSGIRMQHNSACLTRPDSPLGIVNDGRDKGDNCLSCPISGSGGIDEKKHGYVKQSRCLDGTRLDFESGRGCTTPGYLKQESKQLNVSHLDGSLVQTDISSLGEVGQASFLHRLEFRESGIHHNDGDVSVTKKLCSSDFIFNTDVQILFPLATVLNANEGVQLDFNSLSLADVECKDR